MLYVSSLSDLSFCSTIKKYGVVATYVSTSQPIRRSKFFHGEDRFRAKRHKNYRYRKGARSRNSKRTKMQEGLFPAVRQFSRHPQPQANWLVLLGTPTGGQRADKPTRDYYYYYYYYTTYYCVNMHASVMRRCETDTRSICTATTTRTTTVTVQRKFNVYYCVVTYFDGHGHTYIMMMTCDTSTITTHVDVPSSKKKKKNNQPSRGEDRPASDASSHVNVIKSIYTADCL